jgi:hypothetical protein
MNLLQCSPEHDFDVLLTHFLDFLAPKITLYYCLLALFEQPSC